MSWIIIEIKYMLITDTLIIIDVITKVIDQDKNETYEILNYMASIVYMQASWKLLSWEECFKLCQGLAELGTLPQDTSCNRLDLNGLQICILHMYFQRYASQSMIIRLWVEPRMYLKVDHTYILELDQYVYLEIDQYMPYVSRSITLHSKYDNTRISKLD